MKNFENAFIFGIILHLYKKREQKQRKKISLQSIISETYEKLS